MKARKIIRTVAIILLGIGSCISLASQLAPVQAADWAAGDVFVGVSSGSYNVYSNSGVFKETISDGLGGPTTGCAFNPALNRLYTTNFSNSVVVVYNDAHPHTIAQSINTANQGGGCAESIVFAANGEFY